MPMNTIISNWTTQLSLNATKTPFVTMDISGKNIKTFLQGQLSADIHQLSLTQSAYTTYCDAKGKIQSAFFIYPISEDEYRMILDESLMELTCKLLKKYGVFNQIKIDRIDKFEVIGLIDPENCMFNQTKNALWGLQSSGHIQIIHYPSADIHRYLLIGEYGSINQMLQDHSIPLDEHLNLWAALDIIQMFPQMNASIVNLFTPPMLSLEKFNAYSLNKGCFLGQEIISRTARLGKIKRHLHVLLSPNNGSCLDTLTHDFSGSQMGHIINSTQLNDEHHIHLALINDRHMATIHDSELVLAHQLNFVS